MSIHKHDSQAEIGRTRAEFESRLEAFVPALQAYLDKHDQDFFKDTNCHQRISIERGPKFLRVVSAQTSGAGRSVYCFLDHQGNIYKSASWRAPAKHVRGSIFEENFSIGRALGAYGAAYLR